MPYEQKEGQGSLFKNDQKESERHPDYRGSIRINGQDYWLSAWIKASKSGQKYMSLSAQPKQAKEIRGAVAHKEPEPDFDDRIPF